MAREILFKAKRKDNGEWVEGFYFCMEHGDGRHVHHFIMPMGADLSLGTPIEKIQIEIDVNTLCQYTGKTDENGNKVWEHDIVQQFADCNELGNSLYFVYEILWNEEYARFEGYEIYSADIVLFDELEDIEVIGNQLSNDLEV